LQYSEINFGPLTFI